VFDFRAHFCHSAPMETDAFGFRFPANARRAKSDFLSVMGENHARYFVVGHGTDDGATSFVPAGACLLLYAPAGHNLEFTVGLSVLAAATSQSVQEFIGLAECPNLQLSNLEPAEQDAVGKNYGRSNEGELVIVGRDCDSKIRLCSQPEVCLAAREANGGQHAEGCAGVFRWLLDNKLGKVIPSELTIDGVCCLGKHQLSPQYNQYNKDEGELSDTYVQLRVQILALSDSSGSSRPFPGCPSPSNYPTSDPTRPRAQPGQSSAGPQPWRLGTHQEPSANSISATTSAESRLREASCSRRPYRPDEIGQAGPAQRVRSVE
jgi:hypothetical protein